MNTLLSLWLPILLSAVVVFIISSLIHMVIKWHAGDYTALANEDTVQQSARAIRCPAGMSCRIAAT